MSKLGDFVREARERRRNPDGSTWTQDDLAEAMGVSRGYIGQMETGLIKRPRIKYRRLFQDALSISDQQWLEATGELGPSPEIDLNVELLRITQIPDEDDRIAELEALEKTHPEIMALVETAALRYVKETFRSRKG